MRFPSHLLQRMIVMVSVRQLKSPFGRRAKFNNTRVEFDGFKFDSKKELKRYQELVLLQKAGKIKDLQVHPRFKIIVNRQLVCTYVADFQYIDAAPRYVGLFPYDAKPVVEDVKSPATRTRLYQVKKKLMKAVLDIDVVEV